MNFSSSLDKNPNFKKLQEAADALNLETYIIGGYVRDLILERGSTDLDVVCIGNGISLAEKFAELVGNGAKVAVFKNFGTAAVSFNNSEIEFVGARKESYRQESRKPIVEDGTLEDDQNRRDFTINAMGIRLNKDYFGELIDPFNGLKDIENKCIRTPLDPEITFSDDPLRMMRAIRFATQLNFDIEPTTLAAIKKMKDRINIISQERITTELNKIILSETPSYGFKLLHLTGLLEIIWPQFMELKGVETQDGKGHKDNFYHTLQVLDNTATRSGDLWLRWAALLHDIAKPATKKFNKKSGWTFHGHEELGSRWVKGIFRKFKLPLDHNMRSVTNLVRLHLRPIALAKHGVTDSALRRLLIEAGPDLDHLMILCRADITSKDPFKVRKYLNNFDKVEELLVELEKKDKLREFQPVISGEIIMEAFELPPSKEVGILKKEIRDAIIDGLVPNEIEPAFNYLIELGKKQNFKLVKELSEISI